MEIKQEGTEPTITLKRFRVTGAGYESMVHHFEKLITTLEAETRYNPGAVELQITALKQTLANMHAANQTVVEAYSKVSQLRMQRNQLLYNAEGSVHKTALAVKEQIRALFGARSETAMAASRISLTINQSR